MASWEMWAHRRGGKFWHAGSEFHVRLHGGEDPVVPVDVSEDPAGPYWGFLWPDREGPSMVWPSEVLFRVCFPGRPEDMEARGEGRVLRLRVSERVTERAARRR